LQHTISHGPNQATVDFVLNEGEEVLAEPESLLAMHTSIEITAKIGAQTTRKWWGAFRNLAAGESMFVAIFRAKRDGAFLSLAPRYPGNVLHLATTDQQSYYLTTGSYLASANGVSIDFKYAGMQGMLAKKGLYLMKTVGAGDIFCSSFGAIVHQHLSEGENFVVDNRFVIAFSETVTYQLVKASKDVVGSYFSGGGLVNRYTGPGVVIYQTRGRPTAGLMSRMFDMAT